MMTLTELFSDPSRWCQGNSAKGKSGRAVRIESKYAVSWCVSGALSLCYDDVFPTYHGLRDFEQRVNDYLHVASFVEWNDSDERTIEDIQAIAKVIDEWMREIVEIRAEREMK